MCPSVKYATSLCRSFGVVLWEMLTGEVPYKDVDSSAIIWGVGNNSLQLPVPDSCPDSFKLLLRQCWWASGRWRMIWKLRHWQHWEKIFYKEGTNNKKGKVIFLLCPFCIWENICLNFSQELQAKKQAFLPTDPPASGHRLSRYPIDSTRDLLSVSGKLPLFLSTLLTQSSFNIVLLIIYQCQFRYYRESWQKRRMKSSNKFTILFKLIKRLYIKHTLDEVHMNSVCLLI